jgi:hypothetical protein
MIGILRKAVTKQFEEGKDTVPPHPGGLRPLASQLLQPKCG